MRPDSTLPHRALFEYKRYEYIQTADSSHRSALQMQAPCNLRGWLAAAGSYVWTCANSSLLRLSLGPSGYGRVTATGASRTNGNPSSAPGGTLWYPAATAAAAEGRGRSGGPSRPMGEGAPSPGHGWSRVRGYRRRTQSRRLLPLSSPRPALAPRS